MALSDFITLWNIAKKYMLLADVEKLVYEYK